MNITPTIVDFSKDLTLIRRDIQAHPESGFEEQRTSQIVADHLQAWGDPGGNGSTSPSGSAKIATGGA